MTTSPSRARQAPCTGAFRPARAHHRISTTSMDANAPEWFSKSVVVPPATVTKQLTLTKQACSLPTQSARSLPKRLRRRRRCDARGPAGARGDSRLARSRWPDDCSVMHIAQLERTLVSVRAEPRLLQLRPALARRTGHAPAPLLEAQGGARLPSPPRAGAIALFPSISPAQGAHFSNARGSSASRV
jgi:hypothetical protein